MNGKAITDPATSIRARLLAHAKAKAENFERVLTRYAIERLLFRLSQTEAAERYVLKGAMLFVTWPKHAARPTGDVDFLGYGDPDPEALRERFTRICAVELPEDGIRFDPTTVMVKPLREAEKYQGATLKVRANLAGARIPIQIDIGFGDHVHPAPKQEVFPSLLTGLPQAKILMYPPETVIAEKFETMIRFGENNGRIKDFYDIWFTIRTFPFDLANMVAAIGGTFQRRGSIAPRETPIGLTKTFAEIQDRRGLWAGFLKRTTPGLEPPPFPELQAELRRFFGPILASLSTLEGARGSWDPDAGTWR